MFVYSRPNPESYDYEDERSYDWDYEVLEDFVPEPVLILVDIVAHKAALEPITKNLWLVRSMKGPLSDI
jgi:hypothetical protein